MIGQSNYIPSESDLIKGCIDGDRQMQKMLYQMYSPKMYGVCLRYSENVDDANDILQEGFIKVYKNIDKFRSEGSFEGWIRRIFINTSIEHFRKKIKFNNISEAQENTIEDESIDVFNSLSAKDIMKAIDQLSPGYKTVFNMHVIEGFSHKEIADILEITEGTSKSQLARAKGILKKLLATSISNSKK